MTFDVETLQKQIPYYLTASDQEALVAQLKAFNSGISPDYFLSSYNDNFKENMLQGDGWRGFELFLFESGERRSVQGLVLSNSCDIDPTNKREVPARVVFAPIVKLSTYEKLLEKSHISAERVDAKIASIKDQKTTNIFYLPASGPIQEDYLVRFDDVHSMPTAAHKEKSACEKLFTLSMVGFYLLVLKLSVHFCRLEEQVQRNSENIAKA
ncbi:hypothetical protein MnTg02_01277 [bacterium MnTg02]|nr:hypothetical protein MnTg02_01277 [bacterium MnTg02]